MGLSAQAFWSFTLYPEAGEGGGCFNPLARAPRVGGGAPDVARPQEEAARRARTKVPDLAWSVYRAVIASGVIAPASMRQAASSSSRTE